MGGFEFLFVLFALFSFVERVIEIKRHKRLPGVITGGWSTKLFILIHLFFFFGSIGEFFLYRHHVNYWITSLGTLIFATGFFLRRAVIKTLGQFWSIEVEIRQDHRLITSGPYTFCRHPNYVAILLEACGFCLIGNAFWTLLMTICFYTPLLIARIQIEERELRRKFGKAYESYADRTPLLLPKFSRLRLTQ